MANPIAQEWLKAARDDLKVIEAIIDKEELTHMVAFHAQQSIEKSFKALLEQKNLHVPKTHSLQTLAKLNKLPIDPLLIDLDSLYIDSRYPGSFGLLPESKPTSKQAKDFFEFALSIFEETKTKVGS